MAINIGMTFSGGGYRAATFDLGTLSFLNSVKLKDGGTLLDCVVALSSVSGGTIPAMKYMLAKARGQDVDKMVEELFKFLCEVDLVDHALNGLSKEKTNPELSSIKIMADIYDKHLFGETTLGEIFDNFDKIPVKDYTALATDFDSSLPFRFRVFDKTIDSSCVFGNFDHRITLEDARKITPGEAMACSSCFPSGFEPMMFPEDFKFYSQLTDKKKYKKEVVNKKGEKEWRGFGIMDGGVSDNQGIESIEYAEERLHKAFTENRAPDSMVLDLVIVSDVSSPDMKSDYAPNKEMLPNWVNNLTFGRLRNYGLISEVVIIILFALALVLGNGFWTGVTSVFLVIATLANAIGCLTKKKIHQLISETFIGNRAKFVNQLKFSSLEAMLMNRAKSVIMMTSEVFLKRLRQLNYNKLYKNKAWENRVFSTAVYELKPDKISGRINNKLPRHLVPSDAIQQNSEKAASMGTTLWFTPEEIADGMPQALLADGQYTACFNLLDHLDQIRGNNTNVTPDTIQLLNDIEPQLLEAWEKFQKDPQWMVPKK